MSNELNRRWFLQAAGASCAAAATAGPLVAADTTSRSKLRILGVCGSLRAGKTTSTALRLSLEAAQAVNPERIETELIELAGLELPTSVLVGIALQPDQRDDFPPLAEKLTDPRTVGVIIGTPVYFGNMSSICKAFLERWTLFRRNNFPLANKVGGVLTVGGNRNGGQELTLQSVHAALMAQDMILVGDGRPTAHCGATLWNQGDDITTDKPGLETALNLGRRVAEAALLVAADS